MLADGLGQGTEGFQPAARRPATPPLPREKLRVQRLDCHDTDDVVGLRLIGAG
jgi:hypothetical protein